MSSIANNAMELNPINWGIQQISSGLQSVTIAPIKDIISYAVPWIKAALNRHVYLIKENRPLIELMGGEEVFDSTQNEIAQLAGLAKIKNEICLYTSLSAPFAGDRGIFDNVVTFPLEHIKDKDFSYVNRYERLLTPKQLEEGKWEFTENETRFLLSIGVAELTIYPLLKLVARVMVLALIIGLFFTPLGLYTGGAAFAVGMFLYLSIERATQNKVDKRARELLTDRFVQAGMTPEKAKQQSTIVAINTVKKIQLQQLHIRQQGWIYECLITPAGDVRFDYTVPSLNARIKKIQQS